MSHQNGPEFKEEKIILFLILVYIMYLIRHNKIGFVD